MKNTIRKAPEGAWQHIYKITADSGVLFYRTVDHLVYYTIESVMSRRYNIPVVVACHMFNHTHKLSAPVDLTQMISCESNINIAFVKEYNKETGRRGRLFKGPFGSAPKRVDKDKRSALIYILNNPVEKHLCQHAAEDRWTFLAYFEKDYPFSPKPVLSRARWALRNAMKEVNHEFCCGRYLRYSMLYRLFAELNPIEQEQLADYIIQTYFYFDRELCYEVFGGRPKLLSAVENSKGKEFDVGEVFDPISDIPVKEMCGIADQYKLLGPGLPLLNLPDKRRKALAEYLRRHTHANDIQVSRFLHLILE
jgi:hypothetical protein